jgi:glutathione S-transferase
MKLQYSSASPFVRKVLAVAHETGLEDKIERIETEVWASNTEGLDNNPLRKIPALTTAQGTFLGSGLCCEYLDSLHNGRPLIPREIPQRWHVLQRHALADGVIEAAVGHVAETLRRPSAFTYAGMLERQSNRIFRTLHVVEKSAGAFTADIDLASITLGCALGYLDFRLPELDWRPSYPALASWFGEFDQRSSMRATKPHS